MAQHYCDGLQTTEGSETGWGKDSVIAMAKHWPGGGTGEGGRDAHYPFGKYAVYPGNNFETHLLPFINGAMTVSYTHLDVYKRQVFRECGHSESGTEKNRNSRHLQ